MGENKGKGTKGRNYDELTGVGTSSAGITGTTGNLNTGTRDGGIGMPSAGDSGNRAGNRQSAEPDDGETTPALGTGTRSSTRQGAQDNAQGNAQGGNQASQSGSSQQSGLAGTGSQGGLGHSLDQDVIGKEQ
jgi:hypothetical protein